MGFHPFLGALRPIRRSLGRGVTMLVHIVEVPKHLPLPSLAAVIRKDDAIRRSRVFISSLAVTHTQKKGGSGLQRDFRLVGNTSENKNKIKCKKNQKKIEPENNQTRRGSTGLIFF